MVGETELMNDRKRLLDEGNPEFLMTPWKCLLSCTGRCISFYFQTLKLLFYFSLNLTKEL
uniref:Uncharacterized protein n=1 Tax=Labrus bergylta TaxID=56723 RepID=A0A3Q3H3P4_9LABR